MEHTFEYYEYDHLQYFSDMDELIDERSPVGTSARIPGCLTATTASSDWLYRDGHAMQ